MLDDIWRYFVASSLAVSPSRQSPHAAAVFNFPYKPGC